MQKHSVTLEARTQPHTYTYVCSIIYFVNNATTSAAERESEASLFRFRLSRTNSISREKKQRGEGGRGGLSDNPPCGFPIFFLRLLHFRKITIPCTHKNILCLISTPVGRRDLIYMKIFPSSLLTRTLSLLLT